ncbi:MAG: DUF2341 domain-containing protein [Crenarchaeota archaeon]|nr:DUF2341 domain-containing protein [Thermoproteota archaeon]
MKKRGFILNTTVLLLIIPLLLLLATYEDASSYIISAQGERVQAEKTFDVVSYLTLDFQKAIELSGKRALVAVVDYVVTTGKFINPGIGANNTVRDLIINNQSDPVTTNPDVQKLMKGQTIYGWFVNVSHLLRKQGYILEPNASKIASSMDMVVAPLDSFHVVIRARLTNVTIRDLSGKVVYTGPIPRRGYVYSIIDIQQLEDPYYSVMSGGRYHRSIRACDYAFPEFTRPFAVANGTGEGKTVAGIFGEDFKHDFLRIWDKRNASIYITNLTVGTSRISPEKFILKNGDTGVIVMNASSVSMGWCNEDFEHRVTITLPQSAPTNSLVLLVFDTSSVASSFGSAAHNGNKASIRVYSGNCTPVGYWIEYWGNDKILIWMKTTSSKEYSIYYSSNSSFESDGEITIFPYYIQNFNLSAGKKKTMLLFEKVPFSSFFIRYALTADSNTTDFDAGVALGWSSTGSGAYLKIKVSYPSHVNTVQVPIYLNSSVASEIKHNSLNEAEIEVYSDAEFNNKIPFWIEYWKDSGALLWVRMNVPGTIYIKYNTGTLTRGNGSRVFLFFDTFSYLTAGMARKDILSALKAHGWNFGGRRIFLDADDGILKLRGDTDHSSADIWLWTQATFPYYSYVVGMSTKIVSPGTQGWLWYVDSNGNSWMERIYLDYFYNAYYGHLYTFDTTTGKDLDINDMGVRPYTTNYWTHVEIAIRDYYTIWGGHYVDIATYQNQTGPFQGTWDGNTVEISYYDGLVDNIPAQNNTGVGLSQFYTGPSEYDFIYVRKYLDLNELSTKISESSSVQVSNSVQFVDDNPGHPDLTGEDNDWLVILGNWNKVLGRSGTTTGSKAALNRYEVKVVPVDGFMKFDFIYNPNSTLIPPRSSGTLGISQPSWTDIFAAIDNSRRNNAHFSWVVAAPYPYASYSDTQITISSPENRPSIIKKLARVYDIQPFINCLMDGRYFGVYNGLSFFERLEEPPSTYSDVTKYRNHWAYIALAHKMQDELGYKYEGHYYPIGLVSFLIPTGLYDGKLTNIFNILGIRLDNTSSVDYYFLPHYFLGVNTKVGYRVWGISQGVASTTDLTKIPFYLDPATAVDIFGHIYSRDLLYGYIG